MSGEVASTARYAGAFARRDAALPGHDSAGPWKATVG